ncbi:unnamed protein product [Lactuca saligna]|uniref:Uncharacterized protein n=1 Tax=Lactuca saligna TaxID=75948 RepID=A0AA35VP59_LACSI|nr:unnamed protein product [Lactuca saligna]
MGKQKPHWLRSKLLVVSVVPYSSLDHYVHDLYIDDGLKNVDLLEFDEDVHTLKMMFGLMLTGQINKDVKRFGKRCKLALPNFLSSTLVPVEALHLSLHKITRSCKQTNTMHEKPL